MLSFVLDLHPSWVAAFRMTCLGMHAGSSLFEAVCWAVSVVIYYLLFATYASRPARFTEAGRVSDLGS